MIQKTLLAASGLLFFFQAPSGVDWIQQISNKPFLDIRTFQFTVRPGGSLTAATPASITMPFCPYGVNGNDVGHWIYVSGGTGTAEAVLITGGTCTSAAAIGSINFTPANNHTGAWTLTSATSGIAEALKIASAAHGGSVFIPSGTWPVHSQFYIYSNTVLYGEGLGAVIQVANNAWPSTGTGAFWCLNLANVQYCVSNAADGSTGVVEKGFTLDMNGANNPGNGGGVGLLFADCTDCGTYRVQVKAMSAPGAAVIHIGANSNSYDIEDIIHGFGTAPCAGGILTTSIGGKILNNYADGLCDSAFIANGGYGGANILISGNHVESNAAALAAAAIDDEGANHVIISNNICNGPANEGCYGVFDEGINISDIQINDNICNSNGNGAPLACLHIFSGGVNTVSDVSVNGGVFQGAANATIALESIGAAINVLRDIKFTGVTTIGGTAGIFIESGVKNLNISGSNVNSASSAGISIDAGNSGIIITGNQIHGNAGGDITDASGLASICSNLTDGQWSGQCNFTTANYLGLSGITNGANENVTTTPLFPTAPNTVANIMLEVTSPTGSFSIGGFATPSPLRVIYLTNFTSQPMTINNQDASSTSTNRIVTPTGGNVSAKVAVLVYSPGQNRWIVESYQ